MKIEINGRLVNKIQEAYEESINLGIVKIFLDKSELQQIRTSLMISEAEEKILDNLLFGELVEEGKDERSKIRSRYVGD